MKSCFPTNDSTKYSILTNIVTYHGSITMKILVRAESIKDIGLKITKIIVLIITATRL